MQYIRIRQQHLRLADIIICLLFLAIPLFVKLPFRVNIFLSWEGAYRLYLGQLPFKDFGLPMGFGYWLIPFLFFKIFGPTFYTLIKAQVLINLISLLSLRGILYNLKVKPILVTLSLLVFCLSYVIYNFWPWYNHSVVVFELASLYFVTKALTVGRRPYRTINLAFGAALAFLSFFTKQDAGAICVMIGLVLLAYHALITKEYSPLMIFLLSFAVIAAAVIIPFIKYDFLYWFNYGQAPHNPRVGIKELLNVLFTNSHFEKIYLCIFILLLIVGGKEKLQAILAAPEQVMLIIICICLIGQAIITRVSSPLPTDHMTYFHAFGFVLLASFSGLNRSVENTWNVALVTLLVGIAFSAGYWSYLSSILGFSTPSKTATTAMVAKPQIKHPWVSTRLKGFDNVLIPKETADGINRLLASKAYKKKDLKVLNMSELTPLALEMNYTPPTNQPLWYHLNIGMFQQQVDVFCDRVKQKEYDIVLFEDIPDLTHFFPYQVRDTLKAYYHLQDTFLAPRKLENSIIEVYVRNTDESHQTNDSLSMN